MLDDRPDAVTGQGLAPTVYQDAILRVPEQFNLMLAGGRGGGKSTGAQLLVLRHVEQYGSRARPLIVRETYKALAEFEEQLHSLMIDAYGHVQFNKAEHIMRLPGGAVIELGQLDSAQTYKKYQGRSFTLLVCEEVGTVKDMRWLDLLRSNLRAPSGIPLRTIYTANPGGIQHAHLHQKYISKAPAFHPFEIEDETWVRCPSTYRDNPHIDQADYLRKLKAACGGDEALLKAWIDGDWNIARGAYFADVIDQSAQMLPEAAMSAHPLIAPWHTYVALDYGLAAPSVAYICAVVPNDGVAIAGRHIPARSLILCDELASCNFASGNFNEGLRWPASVLAERLRETCHRWGMQSVHGVGDDAAGIDESLLNYLQGFQINLVKPVKGRIAGWSKMRTMLNSSKTRDGLPGLYVSARCRYWWATVPTLPRDEWHPEDIDTSAPDHGADASRYACMNIDAGRFRVSQVVGAY